MDYGKRVPQNKQLHFVRCTVRAGVLSSDFCLLLNIAITAPAASRHRCYSGHDHVLKTAYFFSVFLIKRNDAHFSRHIRKTQTQLSFTNCTWKMPCRKSATKILLKKYNKKTDRFKFNKIKKQQQQQQEGKIAAELRTRNRTEKITEKRFNNAFLIFCLKSNERKNNFIQKIPNINYIIVSYSQQNIIHCTFVQCMCSSVVL